MRRLVHLHGHFADYHPGPIEVFADTVWEAVEAVTSQIKAFAADPVNGRQVIQVLNYPTIEQLKETKDNTEDIHIFPPIAFGKNGGFLQTIIGATLLVVAFFVPITASWLVPVGISMILGGIIQMLSPQPELNIENSEQVRSKYLPGGQNTVRIGTTIPLLYGTYRVPGHLLSINIDAKDTGL